MGWVSSGRRRSGVSDATKESADPEEKHCVDGGKWSAGRFGTIRRYLAMKRHKRRSSSREESVTSTSLPCSPVLPAPQPEQPFSADASGSPVGAKERRRRGEKTEKYFVFHLWGSKARLWWLPSRSQSPQTISLCVFDCCRLVGRLQRAYSDPRGRKAVAKPFFWRHSWRCVAVGLLKDCWKRWKREEKAKNERCELKQKQQLERSNCYREGTLMSKWGQWNEVVTVAVRAEAEAVWNTCRSSTGKRRIDCSNIAFNCGLYDLMEELLVLFL